MGAAGLGGAGRWKDCGALTAADEPLGKAMLRPPAEVGAVCDLGIEMLLGSGTGDWVERRADSCNATGLMVFGRALFKVAAGRADGAAVSASTPPTPGGGVVPVATAGPADLVGSVVSPVASGLLLNQLENEKAMMG